MSGEDLSRIIANYASAASFQKISTEAVEAAKKSVLDTLGVILAASGMEPACRIAVDLVKESGGHPESSIIAFGGKVPAVMAAFANGAMAHSLDYDDHTPWGQHGSSSILPAVFAIAERKGKVSGKDLITAIAVGQDLFNRLRKNIDWKKDWFFTTVIGVFSAAVAAARVLNLSADKIANAIGIASLQSSGTTEMVNATGSNLRAVYAGFPAKGAALAALLAERGLGGVPTIFEGRYGILPLYFGNQYDRSEITAGLGEEFTGGSTLYKRWPTVGTAHSHIHAAIGLVKDNNLMPQSIKEIKVFVGDYHKLMSEPLMTRRAPKTLVEAKFSLPFLVAIAVTGREVKLSDFTESALQSPEILNMAQRVSPVEDRSLDWKLELPAGRVEITTHDGRRYERVGTNVPGSPEAPMNWDDICRKFTDCASVSVSPMSSSVTEKILSISRNLEAVDDVTALFQLASNSPPTGQVRG